MHRRSKNPKKQGYKRQSVGIGVGIRYIVRKVAEGYVLEDKVGTDMGIGLEQEMLTLVH